MPSDEELEEFNKWREKHGLPKLRRNYRKKIRTFYLSEESYTGLKFLAQQYKFLYGGTTSVSAFIESIGLFELLVIEKNKNSKVTTTATVNEDE